MQFTTLFYIAFVLLAGLIFGRIVKLIRLPNVTGYLIAGLILGPYCINFIPQNYVINFELISEMALAFIAFAIGAEFKLSYLRRIGIESVVIATFAALLAMGSVTLGLVAFGFDFKISLLLGAIASATAPAATVMVIKQYNAKGPVSEMLLSVVAIDDAVALIAFGFSTAIVNIMMHPGETSITMSIISPFIEIIGSILLGFVLGALFTIPLRYFKKDSNRLIITSGLVFIGSALATMWGLSPLLLCMAMGAMLANVSKSADSIFRLVDGITGPIYLMFFVVSGMGLNISVLPQVGLMGIIYIISRIFGKVAGSWLGATIMKSDETIKKHLGFTLIPQAGVAIGLALIASRTLPEYAQTINAIVLSATFIYELIGPVLTKIALTKAREIT